MRSTPRCAEGVAVAAVQAVADLDPRRVVERFEVDGRTIYTLAECGRELVGVVEALGAWSVRWMSDLVEKDLDPSVLMWDICRTITLDQWPRGPTVVARTLSQIWRGDQSWQRAALDGSVSIDAPRAVFRAVPTWIGQSGLAALPRPA
jgi:hypothetical protein